MIFYSMILCISMSRPKRGPMGATTPDNPRTTASSARRASNLPWRASSWGQSARAARYSAAAPLVALPFEQLPQYSRALKAGPSSTGARNNGAASEFPAEYPASAQQHAALRPSATQEVHRARLQIVHAFSIRRAAGRERKKFARFSHGASAGVAGCDRGAIFSFGPSKSLFFSAMRPRTQWPVAGFMASLHRPEPAPCLFPRPRCPALQA